MKFLVLGSGGREHALAWKLGQEGEVFVAPGNPGMEADAHIAPLDLKDHAAVVKLAQVLDVDLVVVGPEDPLVAGIAGPLRSAGMPTFGPGAEWARLEGSKEFSKNLMHSSAIPTAASATFVDPGEAKEHAKRSYVRGQPLAVKADGNALGKGVVVAATLEEALEAIDRMMVHREFGEAGAKVVLEERLIGREFSLLTLMGDRNFVSLPVAQDHKRAFDGDQGPNTGGMGAYSPCSWVSDSLLREVETRIVAPVAQEIRNSGALYRGVLFTGVMVTDGGPKCLEFNVRFGDPETQAVLARLGPGLGQALLNAAIGNEIERPEVSNLSAVTVVVASGGYPGPYRKGLPITIGDSGNATIFWAGAGNSDGRLITAGGRVAAATGVASDLEEARSVAYRGAKSISFDGAFFRSDIAALP